MTWLTFVVAAAGTVVLRTLPVVRPPASGEATASRRLHGLGAAAAAGLLVTALLGLDGDLPVRVLVPLALTALVMRRTGRLALAFGLGLLAASVLS